jgi:hypothetical protein
MDRAEAIRRAFSYVGWMAASQSVYPTMAEMQYSVETLAKWMLAEEYELVDFDTTTYENRPRPQ